MYRNAWYDFKHESVWMSTWDRDGNRVVDVEPFKPYLYVVQNGYNDGVSIYGENLRKISFSNPSKRKDYCQANKKTYYNLPPVQQYLIDRFRGKQQNDDFSKFPLSIYFIDIETFSPNGFPDPLLAEDEITVITVYSTLEKTYHVFCVGVDYYPKENDVTVHFFQTERDMIRGFIRWWRKDFPDIISGWYSNGFDLPYICNRIDKIYGEKYACSRLSPVGRVRSQDNAKRRYGAVEKIYDQFWTIDGISHIDMQAAYLKFAPKKLESYSLNAVCGHEGVGQKLEYEGSLADFWLSNPQEFVDYNVQDVRLLVKLEEKLKYMQLCRHNAYSALTTMDNSLGTIPIITGLVALEALSDGKIISSFDNTDSVVQFEGGYVRDPEIGFAKSIMSIDANSLYPSIIRTLNISNETKIGWWFRNGDEITIKSVTGKVVTTTPEKFRQWFELNQIAVSPSGVLFSQKRKGILPRLVERLYNGRKKTKKEMLCLEKEIAQKRASGVPESELFALERKAEFLDIRQWLMKIQLNSLYGGMAEVHYALFDLDLSKAVTHMGRYTIQKTADYVNEAVSQMCGHDTNAVLYGDTDSIYLTIDSVLKSRGLKFIGKNGKISDEIYKISEEIASYADKKVVELHQKQFNCINPAVGFKREALADSGLFLAPKMYALHVLDDEGVPCDKVVYHGMAVVRSSTPSAVKPMITDMVDTIIKTADRKKVIEKAQKHWLRYCQMPMMDKVVSIGLNGLGKYMALAGKNKDGTLIPAKGTPRQVCASIIYNNMIDKDNLGVKYEKLKEGDKIKIMYCLPNNRELSTVAFKDKMPDEWKETFKIDDATMFDKTVWSCVQKCFDVVGWKPFTPSKNDSVDLFTLMMG